MSSNQTQLSLNKGLYILFPTPFSFLNITYIILQGPSTKTPSACIHLNQTHNQVQKFYIATNANTIVCSHDFCELYDSVDMVIIRVYILVWYNVEKFVLKT